MQHTKIKVRTLCDLLQEASITKTNRDAFVGARYPKYDPSKYTVTFDTPDFILNIVTLCADLETERDKTYKRMCEAAEDADLFDDLHDSWSSLSRQSNDLLRIKQQILIDHVCCQPEIVGKLSLQIIEGGKLAVLRKRTSGKEFSILA